MAAKKTLNKSAFVRSLPRDMPAKEVVSKAKSAGIVLTDKYVATIRYNAKAAKKKTNGATAIETAAPAERGPGRPRKVQASLGGGLIAEIERIVERKVAEVLRGRLGAIFGEE